MMQFFYRSVALLPLLLLAARLQARIYPQNGAVLNQTQVLFEYDEVSGADYYEVVVKADYALAGAPPLARLRSKSLALVMTEGLRFGNGYQWYFEAFKGGKPVYKSGELFFTIKACPFADTNLYRFTVTTNQPGRYKDGIIFIDQFGLAINRRGQPVWFVPSQADSIRGPFRNMQLTADGTVTYLDNTDSRDIALTGELVWQGPNTGEISGDSSEYYHHDFAKMPDGTYMAAGYFFRNEPNYYDNSVTTRVRYNTLIQYNAAGKVLWYWNEKDHTTKPEMFRNSRSDDAQNEGTHMNGFSYDAGSNGLLLSFRNNSTILKIDKRSGKVLYNLAQALQGNRGVAPYNSQHGPYVMRNGHVLVYNNNSQTAAEGGHDVPWPRVQQYSQPKGAQPAKLVWEYEIKSDKFRNGIRGKEGYVQELPDGHFLVGMGGANFMFEVTPAKERVWECYFEKLTHTPDGLPQWQPFTNYRAHYSPSLYPRWFTVQQLTRTWQSLGAKPALGVQVNNEGTADDQYTIEFTALNGQQLPAKTITIKARSSSRVQLPLPGAVVPVTKKAGRVGVLTVYPVANPLLKREVVVELF